MGSPPSERPLRAWPMASCNQEGSTQLIFKRKSVFGKLYNHINYCLSRLSANKHVILNLMSYVTLTLVQVREPSKQKTGYYSTCINCLFFETYYTQTSLMRLYDILHTKITDNL